MKQLSSPMRIWIDGYEANVPQRLGSSQVAFELLKHIERIDHINQYTVLLPSVPMADLPKQRSGWRYKIVRPSHFKTLIAFPLALYTSREKPDIMFSPTHFIPRFAPCKRIATIFDLSYLHFPEMFKKDDLYKLRNWTKFSIQKADHIITISDFSKRDIIKQYRVSRDKITVAYPGYDSNLFRPTEEQVKINQVLERYRVFGDYIIYIGTIQPRKNLVRLINVVAKISDLKLVIVGKTTGAGRQGWKFEEILKRPRELGIEQRVIFTGFAPSEDLPFLISGAKAFILPSLWEGFGIPAVEAMACRVPVLLSNVSSLPEIIDNGGLMFDPYSEDQMEQAIRLLTSDKKLWLVKSRAAIKQARKFSWDKMAKIVLKTFETM